MRHIKKYSQLFENQQELTQEQKDWLDKCVDKGSFSSWKLNPQTGLVDVNGNFNCSDQSLTDLKGVRFGDVGWDFNCSRNSLTSLDGAPRKVGGDFYCHHNSLTSLEGAPQSVGGYFDCSDNSLTSLEGAPRRVKEYFNCENNQLTSLEGAPQIVEGNFYCSNNQLTSLKGTPQKVNGYLTFGGNPISEDAIMDIIQTMNDRGITLEEAVSECWSDLEDEDKLYLAKHNPDLSPEEKGGYQALERHKKRLI